MFKSLFGCGPTWWAPTENPKNPDAAFAAANHTPSSNSGGGGSSVSAEDKAKYEASLNQLRTKIQELEDQNTYWLNTEIPQHQATAIVCGEQGPRGRAAALNALKAKKDAEAKVEENQGILGGLRGQLKLMMNIKDTAEIAEIITNSGAVVTEFTVATKIDANQVHKVIDVQKQHAADIASVRGVLAKNRGTTRPVLEEDLNSELDDLLAQKAAAAAAPVTLASVAAPYATHPPTVEVAKSTSSSLRPPSSPVLPPPIAYTTTAAASATSSGRPSTRPPPPSSSSWDKANTEL